MRSILSYFVTRLALTVPMLLILLTIVFVVLRVMPGDPAETVLGAHAPKGQIEQIRKNLGLDKPKFFNPRGNLFDSQYFDYLAGLLRFDLGSSMIWSKRPVAVEIREHFPATLELTLLSMAITVTVGVFGGAAAARRQKTPVDYGLRIYGILIYSIPVFWLGLMLQLIFGVFLRAFPVSGRIGAGLELERVTGLFVLDSILTLNGPALTSSLRHIALPSVTLGLSLSGIFVRLTRANMIHVLKQDFVTAARLRGLRERRVVYRHALKNAFIPILTMMGLEFAILLAGAVLTETTFSWPGMGRYLVERILYRDFNAVQGGLVFFALLVTAVSLVVDIVYAAVDPRIRY
jgi:peptide/nickel transport system permease protein